MPYPDPRVVRVYVWGELNLNKLATYFSHTYTSNPLKLK